MSYVSIPVETDTFLSLSNFLREKGSTRDPVLAVSDAIDYWIDNASWKEDDLLPELRNKTPVVQGFRWKSLFLPDKTAVRMRYKGSYHYAEVVGDQFIYNGAAMSPGSFANAVARSSRNAWRDLEIRRPQDNNWKLAEILR